MLGGATNILLGSLQQLANQMMIWIPKIVLVLIIWGVGKYLIGLAVRFIDKIDLGFDVLPKVVAGVGKFVLVLVILDYLGIGRTVIGAVVNGATLAVAIALGIAFGRALEGEAKRTVELVKKQVKK